VIGKFGPKVCNVNCPVGVVANCACVGSGGGGGMVDVGTTGADVGNGGGVGIPVGVVGVVIGAVIGVVIGTVGNGGGVGIPVIGTVGAVIGAVGAVGVDTGVAPVGNTVAVDKGRVPKDAPPVAGRGTVPPVVSNGVGVSALPLGLFPNNLINTVLSSDSPKVSLDFCNLGIVFCM